MILDRFLVRSLLCVALLCTAAPPLVAQEPDIDALLKAALGNARGADRTAWAEHTFYRTVTRQRLDDDGEVEWRMEMTFKVTPSPGGGFDEELIELDGKSPSGREVSKHRKKALFSKHYEQTEEISLENPLGADLPLAPLIFEQEYRYVGSDEVDGIPCHRLAFDARPDPSGESAQVRLRYAMKGNICIAKDDERMMQIKIQTVRGIKSAIKIGHMMLHFEARPAGDAWLPKLFELRSEASAIGMKFRTHNFYRYTDYEPHAGR